MNYSIEGSAIPFELKRMLYAEPKPLLAVFASSPQHPGGIIYEGIQLDALSTSFDGQGKIKDMRATFYMMDTGRFGLSWYPDTTPKDQRLEEILGIEAYWNASRSTRVSMDPQQLEQFIRTLPQSIDNETLQHQLYLEKTLPRPANSHVLSLGGPRFKTTD